MKLEGLEPISHEAIYQHLWAAKNAGGSLHIHPRHKTRSYRKRGSPRERRGRIPGQRSIDDRPPEVEYRARFGETDNGKEFARHKLIDEILGSTG